MRFLSTILLLTLITSSYAQQWATESAKFFFIDNIGRSDTVVVGVDSSSTNGIDLALGEADLYGSPYDSLDARIFLRMTGSQNCPLFITFPSNLDTKVDFRPYTGVPFTQYLRFEIYVHAVEYPVTVKADFTGLVGMFGNGWGYVQSLDSACVPVNYIPMWVNTTYDSLMVLPDSTYKTLSAQMEFEVSVQEYGLEGLTIQPNPTGGRITISLEEASTGVLNIRNYLGQLVMREEFNNIQELDISIDGPAGIYFLQLEVNGQVITKKVVKE